MTMKCPYCPASVEILPKAETATCSQCQGTFRPVLPEAAPSVKETGPGPARPNTIGAIPSWINPWGLGAACLAGLAVNLAVTAGMRWLTIALSLFGMALGFVGVWCCLGRGVKRGSVSLAFGEVLCAGVLGVALFAPEWLNAHWKVLPPPPPDDPHLLERVSRDKPLGPGKPLAQDDWVDAAKEVVRQDDMVLRVHSVKVGQLPDKGTASFLIVNLVLGQVRDGRTTTFTRFAQGENKPKLTDGAGRWYAFLGDRVRKLPTHFERTFKVDQLLIFQLPPAQEAFLNLEVPASAWGREGVCRFRIQEVVHEPPPDRAKMIQQTLAMLRKRPAAPPDPALGRALFTKTCVECHTLFGEGGKVGPTSPNPSAKTCHFW